MSEGFRATRKLVEAQLIKGQNRNAVRKEAQKPLELEPGDAVWVYQYFRKTTKPEDVRTKKLAFHWHGPYRVMSRLGANTYRVYIPTHPNKEVPINVDRLKKFAGYWSRPYDDEIPDTPDVEVLDETLLPPESFVEPVTFSDNDVGYSSTESAVKEICDKRRRPRKEVEYLVRHANDEAFWIPRSRLSAYTSFITEYEDSKRSEARLPPLRRSIRLAEADGQPEEVVEY